MKRLATKTTIFVSAAIVACLGVVVWFSAGPDTERIRTFGVGVLAQVAYSPDGRHMATCGAQRASLWDVESGNCIRTFKGHTKHVMSVTFSPDGTRVLTGSFDNTAKLWDAATGTCIQTFTGHSDWIWSVAFSPDGKRVLTGSKDKTAKLWDAVTGNCIRTFKGHAYIVTSVAFSPDGTRVLTGSADKTAKLSDAAPVCERCWFCRHCGRLKTAEFRGILLL